MQKGKGRYSLFIELLRLDKKAAGTAPDADPGNTGMLLVIPPQMTATPGAKFWTVDVYYDKYLRYDKEYCDWASIQQRREWTVAGRRLAAHEWLDGTGGGGNGGAVAAPGQQQLEQILTAQQPMGENIDYDAGEYSDGEYGDGEYQHEQAQYLRNRYNEGILFTEQQYGPEDEGMDVDRDYV